MTCGPQATTFRVVDANSYWDVDARRGADLGLGAVAGLVIGDRIELARSNGVGDGDLLPRIPPRWLARGCGSCTWWLASACPPGLVRSVGRAWLPAEPCDRGAICPSAVAATSHRVAVRDPGRASVRVYAGDGHRLTLDLDLDGDGPIALDRDGTLYAVDGAAVRRFDRDGRELRAWHAPDGVDRIAVSDDRVVWLAVAAQTGQALYRRADDGFVEATFDELTAAIPASNLVAATAAGFCLELPTGGADPAHACFDRCGRPLADDAIPPPAPTRHVALGSLVFGLIDSGIPRCVWHRVRVEADVPPRTSIEVQVATIEASDAASIHDASAALVAADWQTVEVGSSDFLIDQPPGRYLHLRLVLSGDGLVTPSIRRLRIDVPRSTSAEWLPTVYREDPAGREFLDRFVSLFDASIEDLDRVITRFPALLDPAQIPNEVVGWLASLVGVALDPGIAPDRRRALIAAAHELFQKRGTTAGLALVLDKAFGVTAAIDELGATTPFQRLGRAPLGATRLFSRGKTRATLGSSALGATRIHAFGDPRQDARGLFAYRVRIQVPPTAALSGPQALQRLERVVEAHKPAHVIADVRIGGGTAILGPPLALGIDTLLIGLDPSFLGQTTRLRRRTVLAPGRTRAGAAISIGRAAIVGATTTLR